MQAYFEPEQDFSISMPQPVAVFCQPPRLLTLEIFANLPVYYFGRNLSAALPFYLKLESKYVLIYHP